jgi:DNA-binding transcriptional LysR family regulator
MQEPLETAELLAFARSAETLSLTRAAAELGLPRPTLSRRLQRLEKRLGTRLLRRTTRRITLTDAGAAFYQHARAILEAVRSAEVALQPASDVLRGRLRVSVPPMMPTSFHSMVSEFMAAYPQVKLEVHASSRHVDLQAEGFDVALRAGAQPSPGLVGRVLSRQRVVAVASPGYLASAGVPRVPGDLARHRCLLGFGASERPQTHWPLRKGGQVRVEGVLAANSLDLLLNLAVTGHGIALLPDMLVRDAVSEGLVRPVLERTVGSETQLMIVYLDRELMPAVTRTFIDTLTRWAKESMLRARLLPSLLREG